MNDHPAGPHLAAGANRHPWYHSDSGAKPTTGLYLYWRIYYRLTRDRRPITGHIGIRLGVHDGSRGDRAISPDPQPSLAIQDAELINVASAPYLDEALRAECV